MTAEELERDLQSLPPEEVRTTRLIAISLCISLCIGLTLFGLMDLFLVANPGYLASNSGGSVPFDPKLLILLSALTAVLFALAWPLSFVLSGVVASPAKVRLASENGVRSALGVRRSGLLVGWALREGVALMGLAVCLLGGLGGTFAEHPWVAIDAVPALVFVIHTLLTLPTKQTLRHDILAALERA